MSYEEAQAWLRGERSNNNTICDAIRDDVAARIVAIETADAASVEQAYWIVKAHREGLIDTPKPESEMSEKTTCPYCGGVNTIYNAEIEDVPWLCVDCDTDGDPTYWREDQRDVKRIRTLESLIDNRSI